MASTRVDEFKQAFAQAKVNAPGDVIFCARALIEDAGNVHVYESIMQKDKNIKIIIDECIGKILEERAKGKSDMSAVERIVQRRLEANSYNKTSYGLNLMGSSNTQGDEKKPNSNIASPIVASVQSNPISKSSADAEMKSIGDGDQSDRSLSSTHSTASAVSMSLEDEEDSVPNTAILEFVTNNANLDAVLSMPLTRENLAVVDNQNRNAIWWLAHKKKFEVIIQLNRRDLITEAMLIAVPHQVEQKEKAVPAISLIFFHNDPQRTLDELSEWLKYEGFADYFFRPVTTPSMNGAPHTPFFRHIIHNPDAFFPLLRLIIEKKPNRTSLAEKMHFGPSVSFNAVMWIIMLTITSRSWMSSEERVNNYFSLFLQMCKSNLISESLISQSKYLLSDHQKEANDGVKFKQISTVDRAQYHVDHYKKINIILSIVSKPYFIVAEDFFSEFFLKIKNNIKIRILNHQSSVFSVKEVLPDFYRELAEIPCVAVFVKETTFHLIAEYKKINSGELFSQIQEELFRIPGGYKIKIYSLEKFFHTVYTQYCDRIQRIIPVDPVLEILRPLLRGFRGSITQQHICVSFNAAVNHQVAVMKDQDSDRIDNPILVEKVKVETEQKRDRDTKEENVNKLIFSDRARFIVKDNKDYFSQLVKIDADDQDTECKKQGSQILTLDKVIKANYQNVFLIAQISYYDRHRKMPNCFVCSPELQTVLVNTQRYKSVFESTVQNYFQVTLPARVEYQYFGKVVLDPGSPIGYPVYKVAQVNYFCHRQNLFQGELFARVVLNYCVSEFISPFPLNTIVRNYILTHLQGEYRKKQEQDLDEVVVLTWIRNILDCYRKMMVDRVINSPEVQVVGALDELKNLLHKSLIAYLEKNPNVVINRYAMLKISGKILAYRDELCFDKVTEIMNRVLFPPKSCRLFKPAKTTDTLATDRGEYKKNTTPRRKSI